MSHITMQEMLEAGMHFGHQTQRWNPKMRPYIYGSRSKIHIINLDKTLPLFNKAYEFVAKNAAKGGTVLFVGTKRQAQEIIREDAARCGMFHITNRWLGGTLTNFQTIRKSVERMRSITAMQEDGTINHYKKKEILTMQNELVKLEKNLGGIKDMKALPTILFVVDPKREKIAIEEAHRLGIPVVAMTDTNCNPENIDFPIPANDDAIKSIKLITSRLADAILAGKDQPKDFRGAADNSAMAQAPIIDKDAAEEAAAEA